ncbi:MAG: DUF3822 family protein [Bacteroidota bacterium]
MAETISSKSYQTLFTFRDKRFNPAALSQYHLSIYVSDTSFKVSCVNPVTGQYLLLGVYSLAYRQGQERVQALEQLYEDHPLLGAKSWATVTLCVGNQQYTLVPQQFSQAKTLPDYLALTCPIGSNTVKHFMHTSLHLTVAFAMDPLLLNWLQQTYEQAQLHTIHQASSLIEGTLAYLQGHRPSSLPRTLVFVEADHLHIIVVQSSHLLYYNRFTYTTEDEFLNYILTVMDTLGLAPNLHEVILGGSISKGSAAHRKARNYLHKLNFIDKPSYFSFRRSRTQSMLATHLDVMSTYRCHQAL